jgi:hypothetical protein
VGTAATVPPGMNVGVDPASATYGNGLALNCSNNDCSAQMVEKEDNKFVYPDYLAHKKFI